MTERALRLAAMMSVTVDRETQEVIVAMRDESGSPREIRLHPNVVGGFIAGLIGITNSIAPAPGGAEPMGQVMRLTGVQPAIADNGLAILELQLEDTLRFPVMFPPGTISVLRTALAELAEEIRRLHAPKKIKN